MPLLWNMAKTFVIHNRLSASLPHKAREYFSLTMDPAAGTVSVSVRIFEFSSKDLVRSITSLQPYCGYIKYEVPRLRGYSWMLLLDCGVYPTTLESREPQRFLVYSDLQTQDVGCSCGWATFVRLALALGVDPYEGGLADMRRGYPYTFDRDLKTSSGETVMLASKNEKGIIAKIREGCSSVSPIKSMAWISVMVVVDGSIVNLIPLKLRFAEKDPLTGKNIRYHPAEDATRANRRELELELALIWIMYAESIYHTHDEQGREIIGNEGVLPVNQDILKTQEEVLERLRTTDSLETRLAEMLPAYPGLVDQIIAALRYHWQNPDLEVIGDLRKGRGFLPGQRSNMEDPHGYVDIWRPLQDNDTFNALRDNFNPLPSLRSRADADLADLTSPMALLARVIIAVSSVRKWPRQVWDVERDHEGNIERWKPRDDIIEDLIPEYELVERISLR